MYKNVQHSCAPSSGLVDMRFLIEDEERPRYLVSFAGPTNRVSSHAAS